MDESPEISGKTQSYLCHLQWQRADWSYLSLVMTSNWAGVQKKNLQATRLSTVSNLLAREVCLLVSYLEKQGKSETKLHQISHMNVWIMHVQNKFACFNYVTVHAEIPVVCLWVEVTNNLSHWVAGHQSDHVDTEEPGPERSEGGSGNAAGAVGWTVCGGDAHEETGALK